MKRRKKLSTTTRWTGLSVVFLIMAACGGADDVDNTGTTQPSATSAVTSAAPETTAATPDPAAGPAPQLAGTEWNVTHYNQGPSYTNVWKTEITIKFADNGTVSGTGGCNTYEATWATEGGYVAFEDRASDGNVGQVIKFDGLAWTEIGCDSEDVMEQESEFFALLQQAGRWTRTDDEFKLHDTAGQLLFWAEPLS